ncbi:hypothetical protein SEVCU120_2071 [Staphylococcus epidermidis VCU120]|jgi:hypothetical protein|uniref:hypothetical protein n=2 Tax=Staphylococcus TaxID=1279 RepID=UPI00024E20DB|nr:hypothetical protein [Staphylococcus epidermidis]EHR84356.1 hypothetical protein SEVCU120_2071 [Staphylococcus epidermidis VCU120]MCG2134990.1 hypothetical protein [Staphylococcus epidermidis]MDU5112480.1 hypothetical protein [Staphylococcus epidermidis]PIH06455.1 hypothetical protein CTJ00_12620 [Staphylococcus epidermidis]
MSRKLLFEDASIKQRDLAIKVRSRLLKDLDNDNYEDIFNSELTNYNNISKQEVMDYISKNDDVIFFIENNNMKTYSVLVNLLMKINRK